MTLLSLQEMLSKTEQQRKDIEAMMDRSRRSLGEGFHPEDASILSTPEHPQGQADFNDIKETLRAVSLRQLMEFLGKSSTTGISGAAYMIPDKIYDILFRSAWATDLTAATGRIVDTPGGTLKVDYAVTGQYEAKYFGSGGDVPQETIHTSQTTITPKTFGIHPQITNDLIEDAQWDVVQLHLEEAGKAMGQFSSVNWIGILVAAANGDGTLNTFTTDATGITDMDDLMKAWAENANDGYLSDTVITSPFTIGDLWSDNSVSAYSDVWHNARVNSPPFLKGTILGLDINVFAGEGAYGTAVLCSTYWRTLVYNKMEAGLVVRKRWLRIENYSNPVRDLVGSVVSAREGYSTVNKDAICLVTEKS